MNKTREGSSQKERILQEAVQLFWKKGYHGTSMKDIAAAYGCKPANIYNFFPQKEAILYEILRSQIETIFSYLKPLEGDETTSPVEQLRFFISRHAGYALSFKKTNKLLFDLGLDNLSPSKRKKFVALRDTYDGILRKIITRGIQSGDFQKIDVKLAAYSITSMIIRVNIWYSPGGRLSDQEIIHFLCDFALRGLQGKAPKSKPGIAKGRNTKRKKTPV